MTESARGLWVAFGAFLIWGVMPLYWHLLKSVPAIEIVLHRIAWSAIVVMGWLFATQGRQWFRTALAQPRVGWMLLISSVLISVNWGLYIWAVNAGHVVEASLGYFINPLLNVVLGVAFLRERLRPLQWSSVALAAVGVLWLTFNYGNFPWIALTLAASFASYGLLRKIAAVESLPGLGVESAYLLLPVIAALAFMETGNPGAFGGGYSAGIVTLLIVGGPLTALPLLGFAYAVRRAPLSVVGFLQYIAPTMQLLIGVLVFHESFGRDRAIGFSFIWAALALFALEGVVRSRRNAVALRAVALS